jgi:SulP family sulfate permease
MSRSNGSRLLPFAGADMSDAELDQEPRARRTRAQSNASATISALSQSYSRNPVRSFAHQTSHGFTDTPQYSSHGVRERSSQLASYALDADEYQDRPRRHSLVGSDAASPRRAALDADPDRRSSFDVALADDTIDEDTEAESPVTVIGHPQPANAGFFGSWHDSQPKSSAPFATSRVPNVLVQDTERTPLLSASRHPSSDLLPVQHLPKHPLPDAGLATRIKQSFAAGQNHVAGIRRTLTNPKTYSRDAIVSGALGSAQTLTGVFLGLLLNILDALSYGYILFPLGSPIFSQTGPDGISIFFVSCIVSQLCYSLGLSTFRGGVGSEMIEVVPFFHKMAYSILERMEGQPPEAIIATTIVSYCLSSVLTGLIFLALGGFKLGNLVSFFPRHILIGCIGGVGFFLVVTGIEVSARLDGSLNYDLETLQKLFSSDTWYLWTIPLTLAISIMLLQRLVKSSFVLPGFFILIFATFYILVKGIFHVDLEVARNAGWIFEKPEAGVKFYRFYTYFSKLKCLLGTLYSLLTNS